MDPHRFFPAADVARGFPASIDDAAGAYGVDLGGAIFGACCIMAI